MTNKIDSVRAEMEAEFDPARIVPADHERELSPDGRYLLEVDCYATPRHPDYGDMAVATIRNAATGDLIVTFKRNDGRWFHGWVLGEAGDYLLCSEDLEGQSVVDLRLGTVAGFASDADRFIWCLFYPSPSQRRLAVVGCYWGCPYEVVVYDFSHPMNLPLPIIDRLTLGEREDFGAWVDEDRFALRQGDGIERTYTVE